MTEKALKEHFEQVNREFGQIKHKAVPIFDDAVAYPLEDINRIEQVIQCHSLGI